ncbi:MAG: hypothetical protein AB7V34_01825 [Brachymonas sp.]
MPNSLNVEKLLKKWTVPLVAGLAAVALIGGIYFGWRMKSTQPASDMEAAGDASAASVSNLDIQEQTQLLTRKPALQGSPVQPTQLAGSGAVAGGGGGHSGHPGEIMAPGGVQLGHDVAPVAPRVDSGTGRQPDATLSKTAPADAVPVDSAADLTAPAQAANPAKTRRAGAGTTGNGAQAGGDAFNGQ